MMRVTSYVLVALCGWALAAGQLGAQTLRQPASLRPAALAHVPAHAGYGYYNKNKLQEEPSPSDAPAALPETGPVVDDELAVDDEPVVETANSCEACYVPAYGCDTCYLFGSSAPFKVFRGDNRWGINAGFWTQVGYHTEGTNGEGDGLMNDYPNHVQLHQQWFFLEKAVDTGGAGFDWGFRFDYVYGTDAPDTQAFGNRSDGWDSGWTNGDAYGNAIPQLYVELGYNDLTAKIGHFYSIMGYEVVPATGNFFYSHAFDFYMSEPFTHTGVLLEQKVTDDVSVLGGWTAGWDTGFERNGGSTFIGGVKLQLTDRAAFSYMTSWGDVGYDTAVAAGSDTNGYMHTLLFTWNFADRWTYVLQSNLMDNDRLCGTTEDTVSLNNYLFYRWNECWAAGARLEWFKDGHLNDGPAQGTAGEVVGLTVGLNYRPAANVVVRPELRWDDYEATSLLRDTCLFGIDTVITY